MGITKTSPALSRWALSYNLRSQIAENTHDVWIAPRFLTMNLLLEGKIVTRRMNVHCSPFSSGSRYFHYHNIHATCLYNIATKDLVTDEI